MGKVCCRGTGEGISSTSASEAWTSLSLELHHALGLQAKCQQQTPERNPVWKSQSSALCDIGHGHILAFEGFSPLFLVVQFQGASCMIERDLNRLWGLSLANTSDHYVISSKLSEVKSSPVTCSVHRGMIQVTQECDRWETCKKHSFLVLLPVDVKQCNPPALSLPRRSCLVIRLLWGTQICVP